MDAEWIQVRGILRKGYGVASGSSQEYPYGSLQRQLPIFQSRGLDLTGCFLGTLNLDIRPLCFELVKPEFTFRDVSWTELHPPEHFSFSRCRVRHASAETEGWIYYPHPETKLRHFQDPSLMEVIAPFMTGLSVGDELQIFIDSGRIALKAASDHQSPGRS